MTAALLLAGAAVAALGTLVAWALCAFAGRLDDRAGWGDPPNLPYHCTQVECFAEVPTLLDLDAHLWDEHWIIAVDGVRVA